MPKIIKKQIKRSMPLFMIFTLVFSSVAVGLVFDLDFNIDLNKGFIDTVPEVLAQLDTASTTVQVRNAPPIITVQPSESPTSASTTPRNVGDAIGFTVTADDPESKDYYLLVCDADTGQPNNGAVPDCGAGTQFCISAAASSTDAVSCTYSPIADPGAPEFDEWWAYVCDAHATEAECSLASQGQAGNDGASPFYVNQAPSFTSVSTYEDDKAPGNVGDPFVIRATTTDSDVAGEADGQHLYVCQTDSFSTTTGCAIELCHGVATSTDYVECSFATSTAPLNWVAPDGTYTVYAFVMDWHGLAANNGNSRQTTYTVINVAPTVSNVVLQSGNDITLTMKGMPEVVASTTSTSVTDQNGCNDIVSATSSIYWSQATSTENCTADDNSCYQIQSTSCELVAGTCGAYPDADVTFICTTTIAYHAIPTDELLSTTNPASSTNWLAGITAIDDNGARGTGTTTTGVEMLGTLAIHINESAIPYGSVRGGQDSGTTNATSTVVNYSNIPIDSSITGTDMDKSDMTDYIRATEQEFDLANFDRGVGGTFTLSSTTPEVPDTVTPRPDSQTDVSDAIYWGIAIPAGKTSGDYSGVNTFTAVLDDDDWPSGY